MKKIIAKSILLCGLASMYACTDWLDLKVRNQATDKMAWSNEATVDLYINGFYPYTDRYSPFGKEQFNGSLTEGLTDALKYGSYSLGSKAGDANYYATHPEAISPGGNLVGTWGETYVRIRRINEFLSSMKKFSTLSAETNEMFEAQARFFRAFLYFQLAKRHGGVILYTDMNMTPNTNRSSEEETWDLIASDLDFAARVLPATWPPKYSGRVTKGAAYALKSRTMLYAKRWKACKDAADELDNLQMYGLMDKYHDGYAGGNKESILEFRYLQTKPYHRFDRDYVPGCDIENEGAAATPTQEMVESYETKTGTRIDWTPWHGAPTTVKPPYDQLEPRFHATVIYNGSEWKGRTMQNSVGGVNGTFMAYRSEPYAKGRTTTGYYLRKLLDESNTDIVNKWSTQTWVELRYAEVLLNRAEACYRMNDETGARNNLNAVRGRTGVGLPEKTSSGQELFNDIRNERKIELAYEGHLYWDMRRWELAHTEYNNYRVHGFKITGSEGNYTYEYISCDDKDRKFLKRLYRFPIPSTELADNSAIEQYEEWK